MECGADMFKQYINGELVEGQGKEMKIVSPATDEVIAVMNAASVEQTEEALTTSAEAFKIWSGMSINERNSWIAKLTAAFEEEHDKLTELLATEVGLTWTEAYNEVGYLIKVVNFFAEEAKRKYGLVLPDYNVKHGDCYHVIDHTPVGVTVGHIPWNHPISLGGAKIGPALASGCTLILKPSSATPLATLYIGEICHRIGFPKGVLNIVAGPAGTVGKTLNESRIPRLIGLIGSSKTGFEVSAQSSTSIKHLSFELGGNAPCIIMPDADLESALNYIVTRKTAACGQGCSNINRIFVHEDIHDKVVAMLKERVEKVKVGWNLEKDSNQMGPLVRSEHREFLLGVFDDARQKGARIVCGGGIPADMPRGNFIEATIIDHCTDDMRVFSEEMFGPVFTIFTFKDVDEVIRRSNKTTYGLAAYLYCHDSRVIGKCSDELEFGMIYVNNPTFGDVNLPHVGIKDSGLSCDQSKWSLDEYYYFKRISIRP